MLHLAGAIVGDPSPSGFCALRAPGFVNSELLELAPGVVYSKKWNRFYLPENLLPSRVGDYWVPRARYTPSGLKLRHYQNEGVTFIDHSVKGVLLGDDVGIGKTIQALHYLYENTLLRPFVVVGPLIALGSWCGEDADAAKYFNLDVVHLKSRSPNFDKLPSADGYYLTYNVLPAWEPWIAGFIKPACVILDEAQALRNPRRKDAQAAERLCKDENIDKRIVMTATPVTNAVRDLWMLLQCAQPDMWGPWVPWAGYHRNSFRSRWASAARDEYGWKDYGESNVEELRYRLSRVLLRRSRFEVRDELPAFNRRIIKVSKESLNAAAYNRYAEAAGSTVTQMKTGAAFKPGAHLSRLNGMAKHLSWAKREVAVRETLDLVDSAWNKKVVVFCWYKRTADYIAKQLIKKGVHVFGPVTGQTPGEKRLKLAAQFRDLTDDAGDIGSVFVGTLGATGMALNPLSCAAYGLCVDLYWVPSTLLQAEGRLHREGQQSDVLFNYLVVNDSIDTLMYDHLLTKAKAIEKCVSDPSALTMCEQLGGTSPEENTSKLLAELSELDFTDLELL
jgi:SNF2 family DNA or RNA helicase